jgi:hypothetical protein
MSNVYSFNHGLFKILFPYLFKCSDVIGTYAMHRELHRVWIIESISHYMLRTEEFAPLV